MLVPLEGLEPPHLSIADFESAASTVPPQRPVSHLRVLLLSGLAAYVNVDFTLRAGELN